jgi:hypothetical protein
MPEVVSSRHTIDLNQRGDVVYVPVAAVPEIAVRALDHETWGSAVVTIRKVYGGDAVDFSPAVTVSNASPSAERLDVAGVLEVQMSVTTPDASAGFGRVGVYGKDVQANITVGGGGP